MPPDIGAAFEHIGFREFGVGSGFEMLFKKRQQDFLLEKLAVLHREINIAERLANRTQPAAVHPRAHHDRIRNARILVLDGAVGGQCTLQIFGVIPAAHRQHGSLDIFQMRWNGARFPVVVVGVVFDLVFKIRLALFAKRFGDVGKITQLQKILVSVLGVIVERRPALGFNGGIFLRLETGEKSIVVRQHVSATVIDIVTHVEIGNRCLRRCRLDGGVRVDDRRGGIKAGIGNAPDAELAVVVRHVLEKPLDGVKHVGAFIDIGLRFLHRLVRAHFNERAFGQVTTAHILADEYITRLGELLVRRGACWILIHAIRRAAIRRAHHQERITLRQILRHQQ